MKTTTLLLSALVLTSFLIAAVPAAEARGVCTSAIDDWCRSTVCLNEGFCTSDLNPVCVTEPCPQPIP